MIFFNSEEMSLTKTWLPVGLTRVKVTYLRTSLSKTTQLKLLVDGKLVRKARHRNIVVIVLAIASVSEVNVKGWHTSEGDRIWTFLIFELTHRRQKREDPSVWSDREAVLFQTGKSTLFPQTPTQMKIVLGPRTCTGDSSEDTLR